MLEEEFDKLYDLQTGWQYCRLALEQMRKKGELAAKQILAFKLADKAQELKEQIFEVLCGSGEYL